MAAYFCPGDGRESTPFDGLSNASDVVKAIGAFLVTPSNPFEGFNSTDAGAVNGLSLILSCVSHAIDTASSELASAQKRQDVDQRYTALDLAEARCQERERTIAQLERFRAALSEAEPIANEGALTPSEALSAREVAIMETLRKGFGVEDIAQAVNLKKASVQQIIAKLKASGELPTDNDAPDRVASA